MFVEESPTRRKTDEVIVHEEVIVFDARSSSSLREGRIPPGATAPVGRTPVTPS